MVAEAGVNKMEELTAMVLPVPNREERIWTVPLFNKVRTPPFVAPIASAEPALVSNEMLVIVPLDARATDAMSELKTAVSAAAGTAPLLQGGLSAVFQSEPLVPTQVTLAALAEW